jgi:hypothetical protein
MRIEIKFTNEDARRTEYFLQRRYKSKAKLETLAKRAIFDVAAESAKEELMEKAEVSHEQSRDTLGERNI